MFDHLKKMDDILPTWFDFPELLECNRKQWKYFNKVFFLLYIVMVIPLTIWTIFGYIKYRSRIERTEE